MTANDLLDIIGQARSQYVLAADEPVTIKPLPRKRLLLIAAIVAVALLLAGCVAVFLRLQDMSIGQETYTQSFDDQGYYIDPVEKTADIISLYGSADSPLQKAAREWYDFWQSCVPEEELEEGEKLDFEDRASDPYRCYTQEMRDKLQEIADKYGLKLLDNETLFQRWQWDIALEGWGVDSLLRPDARAKLDAGAGYLIPPQNIQIETTLRLTGEDAAWTREVGILYRYDRTDYMPSFNILTMNLEEYQQWNHTAPDGTRLLLALNRKGQGAILAERKDAIISITVTTFTGTQFPSPEDVINEQALEQIADAFDYGIQPGTIDIAAIQPKMDAAEQANQEKMLAASSYGGFQEYLRVHPRMKNWYYSFYDLDGNGEEELLLGSGGTGFSYYLVMHEGEAKEYLGNISGEERLLENGGLVSIGMDLMRAEKAADRCYYFTDPLENGYPMAFDFSGNGPSLKTGTKRLYLRYEDGVWSTGNLGDLREEAVTLTEAEAQTMLAQYPEIPLEWTPLKEYPMDENGKTLAEVWEEADVRLSPEALRKTYAEIVTSYATRYEAVTQFALEDMNGDGVEDLILCFNNGDYYQALTWRYGIQVDLIFSFDTYHEGGVWGTVQQTRMEDRSELTLYQYYRTTEFRTQLLDELAYHKATDQWVRWDEAQTPMTAAEAEAIQAKYPRQNLELHPIEELTG